MLKSFSGRCRLSGILRCRWFQPLYTTIQYNGWVGPNPKGYTVEHEIHAKFESTYVTQNITAKDFARFVHAPQRLADPFADYVNYLRESNRQGENVYSNVYSIEKTGGFTDKGSHEAFDFTTHRLEQRLLHQL
jgi:hypothetical protein